MKKKTITQKIYDFLAFIIYYLQCNERALNLGDTDPQGVNNLNNKREIATKYESTVESSIARFQQY